MTRILVVDDAPAVRELECVVLEAAGYETVGAASGDAALELLDETIDLVITDVVMPGIDGFALIERIHERRADLPILLVTGAVEEGHARSGPSGAAGVLFKPFSHAELREAVARALTA